MELMDVIHAAETALRMDFGEEEAEELRRKVIGKNENRGYYLVREENQKDKNPKAADHAD